MHGAQRDRAILRLVAENEFVSVQTITEQLEISEATIRRDLRRLSDAGRLRRVRGGAQAIERPVLIGQPPFGQEEQPNAAAKRAIGRRAATLCDPGDAVILDGGTTVFAMTEFLPNLGLQVLTPSLPVAHALATHSNARITIPGGELFREQQIIASPHLQPSVESFSARRMFFSAQAVGPHGLHQTDSLLVASERALMNRAEELVALVDSSKFLKRGSLVACPLDRVDVLISDTELAREHREVLVRAGVRLILVEAQSP